MKQYITAIIILLTSCSQVDRQELQVLQRIIDRDFKDCPTYHKLIPIKVQQIKDYNQYKKENNKISNDTLGIPKAPPPPDPNPRINVPVGYLPFSNLIQNFQISEIEYDNIIKECKLIEGRSAEIEINQIVKENFIKIMTAKSIDKYQEFGYPILIDDKLIIYRNIYDGIKFSDTLGLIGNGTYFIYSKIDGEWVLINKITKWIT
jgi:hypothetical protein